MSEKSLQSKVMEVLNQLRPYLQQDGGDLEFVELTEDKVVKVRLTGACGCCPHAVMTLKQGVEQAVKRALPEIKSVEAA